MSYTPPSGSAVAFSFPTASYTPPTGTTVNFSFAPTSPVAAIQCNTTVAFFGKVDGIATFSSATNTSVYFEHPYRSFTIPTSTDASFVTWQRTFAIDTSTATYFRHGFRTSISTGTTVAPQLIATLQATANIAGTTNFVGAWRSFNYAAYAGSGSTYATFAKIDNQPRRAVFFADTNFAPKPRSIVSSAAVSFTNSQFVPRQSNAFLSSFSAQGSSAVSGASAYGLRAVFTSPTATAVTFSGLNTHARAFSTQGATSGAFASSYIANTPYQMPDYDAMLYVRPKHKDIFTGVKQ